MFRKYRPWGRIDWMFPKLPSRTWNLVGCLASESRCLAAYPYLKTIGALNQTSLWRIVDPPSHHSRETSRLLDSQLQAFLGFGGTNAEIEDHELFERPQVIVDSVKRILATGFSDLILDISCFPKRFFFPIVREFKRAAHVNNLLIVYAVPETYESSALVENPEPWNHLPLFAAPYPEPEISTLIVGMGFQPLGLPDLLQNDYRTKTIKLLFPFPPGAPFFHRTMEFVRIIEQSLPRVSKYTIRVDTRDLSDIFEHIVAITNSGQIYADFAPFGPKPMSLAMCLYAAIKGSAVYYTQPKVYHPHYSTGIATTDGKPEVYCYAVKLNGRDLYTV